MGDTQNTADAGDKNGQDSGYKAPETQADLDRIIQDRVARERAKYEDYEDLKAKAGQVDGLQSQITSLEAARDELTGKVEEFQREKDHAALVSSVAKTKGVPAEALRGDTKEALEAHADELKPLLQPSGPIIPNQAANPSKVEADPMREFARNLFDNAKAE